MASDERHVVRMRFHMPEALTEIDRLRAELAASQAREAAAMDVVRTVAGVSDEITSGEIKPGRPTRRVCDCPVAGDYIAHETIAHAVSWRGQRIHAPDCVVSYARALLAAQNGVNKHGE